MTSRDRFAAVGKLALLILGCVAVAQAGAQGSIGNPELAIPVTLDNSCEFGHVVFSDEFQGTGPSRINLEQWTNQLLTQAAKHCTNGSQFSITRARSTGGWPHDMYQIAALLCERPDIKEAAGADGKLSFRCTATKLDKIKAKLSRGEQPFFWNTDRVPPRPDDLGEQERRAAELRRKQQQAGGEPVRPAAKAPVDPNDCSVPANLNTNRCKSLFLPRGF